MEQTMIAVGHNPQTAFFDSTNGRLKGYGYLQKRIALDCSIWHIGLVTDGAVKIMTCDDMRFFSCLPGLDHDQLIWESEQIRVVITFTSVPAGIKGRIAVECLTGDVAINEVVFPRVGSITGISPAGANDYLLLPWQNGWLIRDPLHTLLNSQQDMPFWLGRGQRKYENEYPAQYSFQFAALYAPDRYGWYFSTEDPDVHIKTLGFYSDQDTDGFTYAITNYPENMGKTNHYRMDYDAIFGIFIGDWQTAANCYRLWAIRQKWCRIKLVDRMLPEKMLNVDLWRINHTNYNLGTRTEEYYETAIALQQELNCHLGLHWYGWNQSEHDVGYPDYIPAEQHKLGWPDKLSTWNKRFDQMGIIKIPYINARLWDENTDSWTRDRAETAALLDQNGAMYHEPWKYGQLKPMCPATSLWAEKVKAFCLNYLCNYGFDGLYMDQVASYNATLCFSEQHPHPLGGGTWWNDSYHGIIRSIREDIGQDIILTTESCCETYLDVFDLFLVLDTNMLEDGFCSVAGQDNCQPVPLFSMIYGDFALSYGSICRFSDTPAIFEFKFVRNLLWGILPSVDGIDQTELHGRQAGRYLQILRNGVDFFKLNKSLFLYGRLERVIQIDCGSARSIMQGSDGVLAVQWEDENHQAVYLLYNFTETEQAACFDDYKISVKAKSFTMYMADSM